MNPTIAVRAPHRYPRADADGDRCELCSAALGEAHEHLLSAESGMLRCACAGCTLAIARAGAHFLRVVPHVERLPDDLVDAAEWAALGVPVGLAWLSTRRRDGQVLACFPGPAGPTQAYPPAEVWTALQTARPALASILPDTEALLVRRLGGVREHWCVSIDVCHRLLAFMRHGPFRLDDFFVELAELRS